MTMRLVYVTDSMADIRMIEGLSRHARVTILAPSILGERVTNFWPPRPPAHADKVILPGGRAGFVVRAARWLAAHGGEFDVAVVLDNLTAALAANLGHLAGGPPVVIQVGRPTLDYLRCQRGRRGWTLRYATAWALVQFNERRAAAIGAVSDYCAVQCRARNAMVDSIPWYGVDTDQFRPGDRPDAKARLHLDRERPVVMLRSRIAPEKDPATFVRAIAELREQGRDITAVYMGGETADMERVAVEHKVEVVSRKPAGVDEIPLWYVAADVDVQTSRAEGLGVSPLEALACETPVVVSDAGGLSQVVDGGRVGALVPVGDHAALAAAIGSYLDDAELAARHGAEGRRWVEERFSVDGAFTSWLALIERAAPGFRPAAPVRVLFVDHETRLSGGQRDLVDLVRALDPDRFEVHVALPGPGPLADALTLHLARVHHIEMGAAMRKLSRWDLARNPATALQYAEEAWRSAAGLTALARRVRPDVIHTNSMKAHLLAIPAARRSRVPLVWHIRDIVESGWLARVMVAVASVAATRVVSLSEVAAAPFRVGRLARRVRVVHNGVRPQPMADEAPLRWRADIGAGDDDVVVVLAGQIARWKAQDVFLEAAALVASTREHVRFAVVGECLFPENEGAYERELHRRTAELGLEDRFVFTGQASAIEPVMAGADIVVHASRLPEPFGRVIVEAMAQSRPVITTTIGAGPELVSEGSGLLVPPDDPEALAAALIGLIDDPDARTRMGDTAHASAARFDIAATGEGVAAVWREVGG